MATDLHDLSISELASQLAARKLSPVELVEALIARVEQYDGRRMRSSPARSTSRAGRPARPRRRSPRALPRPLHGIPFG
jgi:Asp-tRNA(Asn)/Glu-tRNA(Gln) amidotransferase A subunit family amidase